jgi:hypothetical protein
MVLPLVDRQEICDTIALKQFAIKFFSSSEEAVHVCWR